MNFSINSGTLSDYSKHLVYMGLAIYQAFLLI